MTDNQARMMWTLAWQAAEDLIGADAGESALTVTQHRLRYDRDWLAANCHHWQAVQA